MTPHNDLFEEAAFQIHRSERRLAAAQRGALPAPATHARCMSVSVEVLEDLAETIEGYMGREVELFPFDPSMQALVDERVRDFVSWVWETAEKVDKANRVARRKSERN